MNLFYRLGYWMGFQIGDTEMAMYFWLCSKLGIRRALRYERERHRREKIYGPFIPSVHGEPLLRHVGATEEQIEKLKEMGLA